MLEASIVIVGGGIAGVSCAESIGFLAPEEKVILISASPLIKAVTNVVPLGKSLMQYDVEEKSSTSLIEIFPSISVINDIVHKVDIDNKNIRTKTGTLIKYNKLCICTGAKPKLISNHSRVLGIRDTESVETFLKKLQDARRVIVIGNGGIATEVVHGISGINVIWVIKDKHISATFVDPGAAEFFLDRLSKKDFNSQKQPVKRMKYIISSGDTSESGPALGPDWDDKIKFINKNNLETKIEIEYECEVKKILDPSEVNKESDINWPVYVLLSNGKIYGCDIIVSATGVLPNSDLMGLEFLKKGDDGGYLVNWKLETTETDIYAAGDVCTANWELGEHWFQMRLWTQAHQMGRYAAKSIVCSIKNEEFYQDFCFEIFSHVTKFFGYKVILLGLYNGQKLNGNYEILLRVTKGCEYVKLIMKNGKMQGAVLIGETDLEEMCENLILNQLDLSIYGEDLLNPDIDIEDYFD